MDRWKEEDGFLKRELKYKDFMRCIDVVNRIAEVAEELNHHPDLTIHGYNHLTVILYTHTSQKVTALDRQLAERLNEIL